MGRAEDRKRDKMLKTKLTDKQFEELKGQAVQEGVQNGIDRFIGNFVAVFKPVMQEFKISSERADKVITEIYERSWTNYLNGDPGESRPQENYLETDKLEKVATDLLFKRGLFIEDAQSISKELCEIVLKVARGDEA